MKHFIFPTLLFAFLLPVSAQENFSPIKLHETIELNNKDMNRMLDSVDIIQLHDNFNKKLIPAPSQDFEVMTPDSAKLKDAEMKRLKRLFGSYNDFKGKFLALQIKDNIPDIGLPKAKAGTPQLLDPNYIGSIGFLFTSPISFFYYNNSKQEISKRKLYALNAYEPCRRAIDSKYNAEKVKNWTGLEGEKLTEFVLFCHFEDDYLLQTSEYELIKNILIKLEEFKAIQDSSNYQN